MAKRALGSSSAPAPRSPWSRLFEPVDIASLVVVRIAFGLLMAWEAYRYLVGGSVQRFYVAPRFLVPWPGFEWLTRWPGDGMYWHYYALLLLGLAIAAGLLYRVSAALFCLGFTYVLLLAQARYNNHFYLICLLSGLLALVPAHRSLSVDAALRPRLRSETAPAWSLWLLRAQVGIVYFYGGLAKLNGDWLQGYPMRLWLENRTGLPLLGTIQEHAWVAVLMSWAGAGIDLFAVPALLYRRTRPFAFAVLAIFHLWNSQIFHIGVFPWLAIPLTTLFFEPDWPRRVFHWPRRLPDPRPSPGWTPSRRWLAGFLCVYLGLQLLLPLRHLAYPGDASWTEEAHFFSWRMMLRDKRGLTTYVLTDPDTGETWRVNPREELDEAQFRKLGGNPSMIQLYARHLARLAQRDGHRRVQVRALSLCSLNGRESEPLVDPEVDLASQPLRFFGHAPWVTFYTKPLRRERMDRARPEGSEGGAGGSAE
jgi:hypothetical protein